MINVSLKQILEQPALSPNICNTDGFYSAVWVCVLISDKLILKGIASILSHNKIFYPYIYIYIYIYTLKFLWIFTSNKLHPYYPKQMVVKPNIIIIHQRKFKYFKICFSISLKKYWILLFRSYIPKHRFGYSIMYQK